MSYQAYQKVQQSNETPRQMEYRLFSQVTMALVEAGKVEDRLDKTLIDALDWNRRVWSHLSTDCGTEGNQLPDDLRAGIISLALYVSKHSSAVMRGEETVDTLIDINRLIMEGLAMQPGVTADQAGDPVQDKGPSTQITPGSTDNSV